jgi:ectoine hydroxylase-related dioxygenase (phytanoyl-CoA dioxygenase family)
MSAPSIKPDSNARLQATDDRVGEGIQSAVERHGYAIVEGVLSSERCEALVRAIEEVESEQSVPFGANEFEGLATRRIFNLIAKGPVFRELVTHPSVLAWVETILGGEILLSGTTSMHIGPGETPQLLHADDGMITLPRPHPATLITTLWALSDFRSENGATRLVPGSHRFEDMPRPGEQHADIASEMPAGSVLILHGSTWHGGGGNDTGDEHRYGLSIQYVAGWCRQQQNLMLGTPREVVAEYPRRLQELIGYSMYRNVMGHVDRKHPLSLLGVEQEPEMVWDRMKRDA